MSRRKWLLWPMAAVAGIGSFIAVAVAWELTRGTAVTPDMAQSLRMALIAVPFVWVPTILLAREYERAAGELAVASGGTAGGFSWQDMRCMTMFAPFIVRVAWGLFVIGGLALVLMNLQGRTSLSFARMLSHPEALFLAGLEMLLLSTAFLDLLSAAMMRGDYRVSIAADQSRASRRWLTARRRPPQLAG